MISFIPLEAGIAAVSHNGMENSSNHRGVHRERITAQRMPRPLTGFTAKVLAAVKRIRRGKILTYREVAHRAGSPKAYRAVGNVLNKNRDPHVPCHRVIRSDGTVGGYACGTRKKKTLLQQE